MDSILFSGLFDLPWWGYVIAALGLTHVTIVGVTVFLHRCQTHRALDLHPAVSHFFRLWLWLTTGMATKEWVAIHRKHHAKCETVDDPHSPQVLGINRVLWGGVLLYVKESHKREVIERYGDGTPDDWLEHNRYSRYVLLGLTLTGLADVLLFGIVPGVLILIVQIVWIPFWAAGVINGVGHFSGYRSWTTPDASTNLAPWGILIGGEELHNNHHTYPTSAKFSVKPYEFDVGWMYISALERLGLAEVRKTPPKLATGDIKPVADGKTLEAVIANRYEVMAKYAAELRRAVAGELERLKAQGAQNSSGWKDMLLAKTWLHRDADRIPHGVKSQLANALGGSPKLAKLVAMREELRQLWTRTNVTAEQLVVDLQAWCRQAEDSGIAVLQEFSRKLRAAHA